MNCKNFTSLAIHGAYVIDLNRFIDNRGSFMENWRSSDYENSLGCKPMVQQNLSYSTSNVLRGMHYQVNNPQSQIVTIIKGKVLDVIIDLRKSSSTFGHAITLELDEIKPRQIYMPPGIAHGFQVLGNEAVLHYMCSRYYDQTNECGVRWDDPDLAIEWPIKNPNISDRDNKFPLLTNILPDDLPN